MNCSPHAMASDPQPISTGPPNPGYWSWTPVRDAHATAEAMPRPRRPEQPRQEPVPSVAADRNGRPDVLRAEEHPTPAQTAGAFELLAEGSGEDPLERLRVVLRHLDEENAVLPTSLFHKAVREAEDLAQLTGSRFLPPQVSQRLNHWRTVLRQHFEVPTPDSPPREVFDRLADEFRAVHGAGDRHWPSVSAVRWPRLRPAPLTPGRRRTNPSRHSGASTISAAAGSG